MNKNTYIENLFVPADFDEDFYEKQIPEVMGYHSGSGYTKRQRYYHHYINYGKNLYKNIKDCEEKLFGDMEVDKNFSESLHEKRHPDVKSYLINYKDLISKRKIYYHHYTNYCIPGSDISSIEDVKNYIKNIRKEFIRFKKIYENHKNSIVLVNHISNPYGATHYLFSLFKFLKKNNIKVCILDEKINKDLYSKYDIKLDDVLSYEQDFLFFCYIYEKLEPKLFYINSIRGIFVDFLTFENNKNIMTHSHEIADVYGRYDLLPNFVVSQRIQKEFEEKYNHKPLVQPEIFVQETFDLIDSELLKTAPKVSNLFGNMDVSKITIGMCGQTEKRKNPELFSEVSKKYPQYNFLWVGGKKDFFPNFKNLYHIPEVKMPFVFYKLIDYFILFSQEDPCPYVVLENLYVNNVVITFRENIYTDHKCKQLENLYYEFDGEISIDSISFMIDNFVNKKSNRESTENGKNYIKNFTKIGDELLQKLRV